MVVFESRERILPARASEGQRVQRTGNTVLSGIPLLVEAVDEDGNVLVEFMGVAVILDRAQYRVVK